MKLIFPLAMSVGFILLVELGMISVHSSNSSSIENYADPKSLKGAQIDGIVHKGTTLGGIHPLFNQ